MDELFRESLKISKQDDADELSVQHLFIYAYAGFLTTSLFVMCFYTNLFRWLNSIVTISFKLLPVSCS